MPLPPEIDALMTAEMTPMQYAIAQYCCSAQAHRLIKWGWEPEVNTYGPRMLILLCMYMPPHTRSPLIMEAWRKAIGCDDQPVCRFMEACFAPQLAAQKATA
jgi:hypothetical protein